MVITNPKITGFEYNFNFSDFLNTEVDLQCMKTHNSEVLFCARRELFQGIKENYSINIKQLICR